MISYKTRRQKYIKVGKKLLGTHMFKANKKSSITQGTYLESTWTLKMELFAETVDGYTPLAIFAKSSILDVGLGSECASE